MNEEEPPQTPATTRRQFVKKAKYVVPALWVLAAAPEQAWASAPASGTCVVSGGTCTFDGDCCSLDCDTAAMICMSD